MAMRFEDLTPEQKERARKCKSADEVLELAKEEGYELSDDELEAVSGGDWDCWDVCTKFQKPNTCGVRDCSPFGVV